VTRSRTDGTASDAVVSLEFGWWRGARLAASRALLLATVVTAVAHAQGLSAAESLGAGAIVLGTMTLFVSSLVRLQGVRRFEVDTGSASLRVRVTVGGSAREVRIGSALEAVRFAPEGGWLLPHRLLIELPDAARPDGAESQMPSWPSPFSFVLYVTAREAAQIVAIAAQARTTARAAGPASDADSTTDADREGGGFGLAACDDAPALQRGSWARLADVGRLLGRYALAGLALGAAEQIVTGAAWRFAALAILLAPAAIAAVALTWPLHAAHIQRGTTDRVFVYVGLGDAAVWFVDVENVAATRYGSSLWSGPYIDIEVRSRRGAAPRAASLRVFMSAAACRRLHDSIASPERRASAASKPEPA